MGCDVSVYIQAVIFVPFDPDIHWLSLLARQHLKFHTYCQVKSELNPSRLKRVKLLTLTSSSYKWLIATIPFSVSFSPSSVY